MFGGLLPIVLLLAAAPTLTFALGCGLHGRRFARREGLRQGIIALGCALLLPALAASGQLRGTLFGVLLLGAAFFAWWVHVEQEVREFGRRDGAEEHRRRVSERWQAGIVGSLAGAHSALLPFVLQGRLGLQQREAGDVVVVIVVAGCVVLGAVTGIIIRRRWSDD